ncbi:hypothetical protein [Variovorax saccharolyticus]|uniref:hypothetical protein n=1 Tax=Variovorax saccharolyticus TaxID=3053516 RepID=UPI002575DF51|nr:hypothetical protein [Variovorax sp. J31P216]MDM0025750.1 hypothetical protein [Variovorax sp. J31P216]
MDAQQAALAAANAATAAANQSLPVTTSEWLVYCAVALVWGMALLTAAVIKWGTDHTENIETLKLRFAAVTFTGIMTLFVFASLMYVATSPSGAGKEIFEKGLTAMFTLAGTVVGYLFGSATRAESKSTGEASNSASATGTASTANASGPSANSEQAI